MSELVTVYRSADSSAEKEAHQVAAMLVREGINATLLDDNAPGVIVGSVEVRVPAADSSRADALIKKNPPDPDAPDEYELVPVFTARRGDGRSELFAVKGLLESGGIFAVVRNDLPEMPVDAALELCVPRNRADEARSLIAEGLAAGPQAAEQAERESEASPPTA
jgi:hypothetical protein